MIGVFLYMQVLSGYPKHTIFIDIIYITHHFKLHRFNFIPYYIEQNISVSQHCKMQNNTCVKRKRIKMFIRLYHKPMLLSLIKVNVLVFQYLKSALLTPADEISTVFINKKFYWRKKGEKQLYLRIP